MEVNLLNISYGERSTSSSYIVRVTNLQMTKPVEVQAEIISIETVPEKMTSGQICRDRSDL